MSLNRNFSFNFSFYRYVWEEKESVNMREKYMFSQKRERRETYNEIYDFLAFPFKLDDRNLIDKHNLLILFTPFKDLSHYNCIVRSAVTLKFNPYLLWNFSSERCWVHGKEGRSRLGGRQNGDRERERGRDRDPNRATRGHPTFLPLYPFHGYR